MTFAIFNGYGVTDALGGKGAICKFAAQMPAPVTLITLLDCYKYGKDLRVELNASLCAVYTGHIL